MRGRFKLLTHISWLPVLATFLFSSLSNAQILNISTQSDEILACEEDMEIIPTCLLRRVVASTPQELITNDLKVCTCLNQSNHLFKAYAEIPSTTEQVASEKRRLLDSVAKRNGNLSVLQASSVADTKRDIEISVLAYGGQESRQKTKSITNSDSEIPISKISRNISTMNQISPENSSWQCVTYQEYSVQREIPSDNEFFLLLKNTQTFKPNEWNVNVLRSGYDAASDEEKNQIRLKLTFLSRNPIFQSIFKAVPAERFPAALISEKQNELFTILRGLKPAGNSNCYTVPNGCWQEIHDSGAFADYANEVGDFLINDSVIDIASAEAAQDYQAELQRIMNDGELLINSIPTDPEGYFRYLQTANSEIASNCAGSTADPSCYTKFQQHCSNIKRIDERVRQGLKRNSKDISSELNEDANIHAKMDVDQNPLFRNFNNSICLQPFSNAAGETLTFFQYRDKHCQGSNQLAECSDRQKLLSRYLLEHNNGGTIEEQNLRSGFANLVSDADFLTVSEVQIEAANNISESPAELRARFGNRFPSISERGQLVPAPVNAIAATNTNPLNNSASLAGETAGAIDSSTNTSASSSATISGSGNSTTSKAAGRNNTSLELPDSSKSDELYNSVTNTPNLNPVVRENSLFNDVIDQIENTEPVIENQSGPAAIRSTESRPTVRADVPGKDAALLRTNQSAGSGSVAKLSGSNNGSSSAVKSSSNTGASFGSSRRPASTKGLFFKYNLDREGNEIRPDLTIVSSRISSEVKVEVPEKQLERIKSNPNSLVLEESELEEIFANPDREVKLILETEKGENLVVYARKDGSGGVSFGLRPSESQQGRGPASTDNIVRIEATSDMYKNISENPDVFLNQNDILIKEIKKQESEGLVLQLVSPGERARSYKVKELYENIYQFREIPN